VDVAEEVRGLAKRMRLFEKSDSERMQRPNKKNLTIEYVQAVSRVTLRADRRTFLFVLYNLLDNAIKYSRRDSEITIEFGIEFVPPDSEQLCLKIKSYGEVIPIRYGEEDLPFEMFWRGQDQLAYAKTGRSFYPGLGVGLWASRMLLESQGGTIWLIPKDETWPSPRFNVFAVRFPNVRAVL
jgi:K+-sensing histidine kinase KdpD